MCHHIRIFTFFSVLWMFLADFFLLFQASNKNCLTLRNAWLQLSTKQAWQLWLMERNYLLCRQLLIVWTSVVFSPQVIIPFGECNLLLRMILGCVFSANEAYNSYGQVCASLYLIYNDLGVHVLELCRVTMPGFLFFTHCCPIKKRKIWSLKLVLGRTWFPIITSFLHTPF
jgi:hypothetical protein